MASSPSLGTLVKLIALLLCCALASPALAADAPTPTEQYEAGMRALKRGSYTRALELLNRVRNFHRDDPVALKAELAIADVYFKKGDYEEARLAYEDFARLHRRHQDLDYVVWRIGQALYKRAPQFAGRDQTPTRQAINQWTGFAERFPESDYRDEVAQLSAKGKERLARKELHIARFYERRHAWPAAARRAERLLQKYPDADCAPDALWLLASALHANGDVARAKEVRDQFAATGGDPKMLKRLDVLLARPAGEPPKDEVFSKPYRSAAAVSAPGMP